jgi:hypothetical protein
MQRILAESLALRNHGGDQINLRWPQAMIKVKPPWDVGE